MTKQNKFTIDLIDEIDDAYLVHYSINDGLSKGYLLVDDNQLYNTSIENHLIKKFNQPLELNRLIHKPKFNELNPVTKYLIHCVFKSEENMYFVDIENDDQMDEYNYIEGHYEELQSDILKYDLYDCIEIMLGEDGSLYVINVFPDAYTRFTISDWDEANISFEESISHEL